MKKLIGCCCFSSVFVVLKVRANSVFVMLKVRANSRQKLFDYLPYQVLLLVVVDLAGALRRYCGTVPVV